VFPPVPSPFHPESAATLARSGENAAPARAGSRQNTNGGTQVPDPIAPPVASRPAEAVELVSQAVSDGDLEAALVQYEAGAVLRPWARDPGVDTDGVADALIQLMDLRLPVSVRILAVLPTEGLVLIVGERHIVGTGPDCEPIQLSGAGATVVRRQQGGSWLIAADAWYLDGPAAGQARS
jgi:ketosteroid isomerase-like protein